MQPALGDNDDKAGGALRPLVQAAACGGCCCREEQVNTRKRCGCYVCTMPVTAAAAAVSPTFPFVGVVFGISLSLCCLLSHEVSRVVVRFPFRLSAGRRFAGVSLSLLLGSWPTLKLLFGF